ncbi:MAG: MFS transporter, partial [Alphaproteobacteria bacterium]
TLLEADHAALEAARRNVTDPRARLEWADVTRLGREAGPFDAVVSNPPFHAGRRAEPELGTRFIEAASRLLDRKGTAHFVANRHLPYERVLERCFARLEAEGRPGGYKILTASLPGSDAQRRHRK